jgi:hypothetical protein
MAYFRQTVGDQINLQDSRKLRSVLCIFLKQLNLDYCFPTYLGESR